jgi:hypothetical protein
MTGIQPFYISNYEENSGLFTYLEPFLTPDKAFPSIEDAYNWRGKVPKRKGYELLGRLQRNLSMITLNTQANGAVYNNADILADPAINVRATEPNAEIRAGTLAITVGGVTFTDNGNGTLAGLPATNSGTINYITGALQLNFVPALGGATNVVVTFSYFPSLPCMGLFTRFLLSTTNTQQTIGFDTKYAYDYVPGTGLFRELPSIAPTTWQGSDSQLFWTYSYFKNVNGDLFWATNFNKTGAPDPLRYYDGTTWTTFNPNVDAIPNKLQQARILLPYKGRLLAFNTYEGANLAASTQNPQRCRFSANGDPLGANAWLSDVVGQGGFIDAATDENIITAYFIKDVLVVKFERSSWRIVYTQNETKPFEFQKVNSEFGSLSTFSYIPFDKGVFSFSNQGIITDDSVNVQRIDLNIPDYIFNFNSDNSGFQRVYGIRDFKQQLVYWAYSQEGDTRSAPVKFPNKVLVYNYLNNSFSTFNDSFTCYGYWQRTNNMTWATIPYRTWNTWNLQWNSGAQTDLILEVIAGNQQGYVEILSDEDANDPSLSITAIALDGNGNTQVTVPNHNFVTGQFITILNIIGTANVINNIIYRVVVIDANNFNIQFYDAVNNIFPYQKLTGTYLGGGQIITMNRLNIYTKVFAPFYEQGMQCRICYIDFLCNNSGTGEFTVNCFIDESDNQIVNDPNDPNNVGIIGNNIVSTAPEPGISFNVQQEKIWHRLYINQICQNFQLQLTLSDVQMANGLIADSEFTLHAMVMYLAPTGRLVQ